MFIIFVRHKLNKLVGIFTKAAFKSAMSTISPGDRFMGMVLEIIGLGSILI